MNFIFRHDILTWINDCLQAEFCKVEELCTGAAQCQLMDMLYPGINSLKLKLNDKLELKVLKQDEGFYAPFV